MDEQTAGETAAVLGGLGFEKDDEEPRGKAILPARIRTGTEILGQMTSGVTGLPQKIALPVLSFAGSMLQKAIPETLSAKDTRSEEEQLAARREPAFRKLDAYMGDQQWEWVTNKLFLQEGADAQKIANVKQWVQKAMEHPTLLEAVQKATLHPGLKLLQWTYENPLPLTKTVEALAKFGREREEEAGEPIEQGEASELSHSQSAELLDVDRVNLENSRSRKEKLEARRQAQIDAKADDLVEGLELAGSLPARIGEQVAQGFEKWDPERLQRPLTEAEMAQYLVSNSMPPSKRPFESAFLSPGTTSIEVEETGTRLGRVITSLSNASRASLEAPPHFQHASDLPVDIQSPDRNFGMLLAALRPNGERIRELLSAKLAEGNAPQSNIVLLDITGDTFDAFSQEIVNDLSIDKAKQRGSQVGVPVNDSALWPYAKWLLNLKENDLQHRKTEEQRGFQQKWELFDKLADSHKKHGMYRFASNNAELSKYLNELVDGDNFKIPRAQLAFWEIMQSYYVPQEGITKAIGGSLEAAAIGAGYEAVIDNAFKPPDGSLKDVFTSPTYAANNLLSTGVDTVGNIKGRDAAATLDTAAKGLPVTDEGIYGEDHKYAPWGQRLYHRARCWLGGKADGPSGPSMGAARQAAVLGAAAGGALGLGIQLPLSWEKAEPWQQLIPMPFWALASSLAIPLEFAQTVPRKMAVVTQQWRNGLIDGPPPNVDPEQWSYEEAVLDTVASSGAQASAKAVTMVAPALTAPALFNFIPGASKVIKPIVFGLAPTIEDSSTAGFLKQASSQFRENAQQGRLNILTAAAHGKDVEYMGNIVDALPGWLAPKSVKAMMWLNPIKRLLNKHSDVDFSRDGAPQARLDSGLPASESPTQQRESGGGDVALASRQLAPPALMLPESQDAFRGIRSPSPIPSISLTPADDALVEPPMDMLPKAGPSQSAGLRPDGSSFGR